MQVACKCASVRSKLTRIVVDNNLLKSLGTDSNVYSLSDPILGPGIAGQLVLSSPVLLQPGYQS